MNTDKKNKNLDELITGAIGRDNLKFDFNKWKQNHKREIEIFNSQEISIKETSGIYEPNIRKVTSWRRIVYIAASLLVISSMAAFFILYEKVTSLKDELEIARRNASPAQVDENVTINFYLKEHQDSIAQEASLNSAASQPLQMQINQDDILYYEPFDSQSDFMSPGIIVRGPSSQNQTGSQEAPVIFNGHTLTLSEARETSNFDLVAPPRLYPAHRLEKIRKIKDRDALHLLYTDGVNSVSLFEQPLDGQRGLSHQDFREYAVYNNQREGGGTILAWRDDALSYVLIGNNELSQLMDMAQSISAEK